VVGRSAARQRPAPRNGGRAGFDIAAEGAAPRRARCAIHAQDGSAHTSLALGALAGDAPARTVERLHETGVMLGFAFQIHDDLLNAGSTLGTLGKRVGTDEARGKATYPAAVGEKRARAEAARIMKSVETAIARHCEKPELLESLIEATARRDRDRRRRSENGLAIAAGARFVCCELLRYWTTTNRRLTV
jgi:hypothetical protein